MNLSLIFNQHRIWALVTIIIGSGLSWFSLVLLSNSATEPLNVSKPQMYGLIFTLIIGIAIWVNKCLTIKPYHHAT